MANLKPIRLKISKPLSGPYDRLLRRPGPEVDALSVGATVVIIRGSRLVEPMPLWGAETACYYLGGSKGWSAQDFNDGQRAAAWEQGQSVDLLAVPVGFFKLPNAAWVSRLAEDLTPWRGEVVEQWRRNIRQALWLTVVRMYKFKAVKPTFIGGRGLAVRVKPLQARNASPICSDAEFSRRLEEIQDKVEHYADVTMTVSGGTGEREGEYDLAALMRETGYAREELTQWCDRLRRKKQMLIYGPPGTGKTFLAERLARYMGDGAGGTSELVQFHASYAYEDFVQGIRPTVTQDRLSYELTAGHFLRFCRKARNLQSKPCVLVVDEINRAHLARVFGELMYLLEYRERSVTLAVGGESFAIPQNVYLIGTMNTADRSIALVDLAVRRRFSALRLAPNYHLLSEHLARHGLADKGLVELLRAINQAVGDPDCELGISFFLVDELKDMLPEIWRGEIEPYLEEVFYDRPDEVQHWRWGKVAKRDLVAWGSDG